MFSTRFSGFALAAALAGGTLTVAHPAPARADIPSVGKIVVVDLQRILEETRAGKRARQSLEASAKAKQRKLETKQKELEADMQKAQALKGQELAGAQQRLQQKYMDLQQMSFTLQQDLAGQESKLLQQIYKNSQQIVSKMARERGYDLVLVRDEGTILHTKSALDITAEVISRYNKKHPK